MRNDCEANGFFFETFGRSRPANPAAVFLTGVIGDFLLDSFWTCRKDVSYSRRKTRNKARV